MGSIQAKSEMVEHLVVKDRRKMSIEKLVCDKRLKVSIGPEGLEVVFEKSTTSIGGDQRGRRWVVASLTAHQFTLRDDF